MIWAAGRGTSRGICASAASTYSIIHIPREEVTDALCEMRRVLRGEGLLLLAFHIGEEIVHLEEWWGHPVSIDFLFFRPEEMAGYLASAGFEIEEVITRPPYADVEYPSHRAYIFAKKPTGFPIPRLEPVEDDSA